RHGWPCVYHQWVESLEGPPGAKQRHWNEQRLHHFSRRGRSGRKSRSNFWRSHATRRGGFDLTDAWRDSEEDLRLAHRLLGRLRNKRMELRHNACHNESRDRHHRRWKPLSTEMIYNAREGYPPGSGQEIQRSDSREVNVKCLDA